MVLWGQSVVVHGSRSVTLPSDMEQTAKMVDPNEDRSVGDRVALGIDGLALFPTTKRRAFLTTPLSLSLSLSLSLVLR